jgi:catechol 2,3-dioxygenase-like lactoylglutathione lyase family enzyme
MISSMPTVEAIAPSFFVKDLARSIEWYVRVLGFRVAFQSADYAGVSLGPATIVLVQVGTAPAGLSYKAACHLRLASGVDDYVAQIEAAGQPLTATVKDRPEYGMREATVRDPDGNDIYIGQDI